MELWYTEQHTDDVRFSIKVDRELHSEQSKFQRIDILESKEFGKFFTLDGLMMVTEKDEFIYHDMIVHVPMATNPNIKKVLVIGAGDGGTVRELTRYKTIEKIDMVEIDERVVELCREYFPQTASQLDEERVNLFFEDGLKFVRNKENEYDLIIVDSTDPFGPGEGLFTKEFYGNCYKALTDDGILVNQHESPYYDYYARSMQSAHEKIVEFFPINRVYQAHIPTYPSGHWLFGFASKKYDPINDLNADAWNILGLKTKYYNTDLHVGCFALPNYVKELLGENIK
ncbi:polyamine aminopropyltransferase [Clostridium weizhouense]|uniref:Polyamine aminopropyltransferase n=1 Tax=Clostridium weizhouense TaxID=2859781 RepID=A0ABS7AMR7_9CLOT|nr:polyamine aminopropyltransferase [Clostridium weizhouense]MBW6409960.1 polyamine aminopropyltransferase [Clostridium weizhouense]